MMEDMLRVLLLLCAMAAPGTSISCEVCATDSALDCNGELQQCPSNSACASSYRLIVAGGDVKRYEIVRSCVPENKCNVHGTMSVASTGVAVGINCCYEDGCAPKWKTPSKPDSTEPNGVQCKTCFSSNSGSCETANTMDCSGDEDQCMTYAFLSPPGSQSISTAFRGCGTKDLCNIQSFPTEVDGVEYQNNFACTNGKRPSSGGKTIAVPAMSVTISISMFAFFLRLLFS